MRVLFRRTMTLALLVLAALPSGCASRLERATAGPDSTLAYAPKGGRGPAATITLCKSISKKSGKPLGAGTVFPLGEKAKVRALIDIRDAMSLGRPELMLHLVWLDGMGNDIFRKRLDVAARDSMETIESVLSVPPDRRSPGRYSFRVYAFRELVAEKRFELVVAPPDTAGDEEKEKAASVTASPAKPETKEKPAAEVKPKAKKKKKADGAVASKETAKKKGKGKKSKQAGGTRSAAKEPATPGDASGVEATTSPEAATSPDATPVAGPEPAGETAPAESSGAAGGG